MSLLLIRHKHNLSTTCQNDIKYTYIHITYTIIQIKYVYRVLMDLLWFSSLMVQNWLKNEMHSLICTYEITTCFVYFVNIEWKTSKPSIGNENLLYILKKDIPKVAMLSYLYIPSIINADYVLWQLQLILAL